MGMAKFIAKDIWNRFSEPPKPVLKKNADALVVEPHRTAQKPVLEPVQNRTEPFTEPLADKRPLTDREAVQVQELYQAGMSKTALCKRVYGSKNGQYMQWIDEARERVIDDSKIIKLRKAG